MFMFYGIRKISLIGRELAYPYRTPRYTPGGCYVERSIKNRNFQPISRFISETMQDMAIVTMKDV